MKLTEAQRNFLTAALANPRWRWNQRPPCHWATLDWAYRHDMIEIWNELHDGCDYELWRISEAGRRALEDPK